MNQNAGSYKKAAIQSASPERLILMLYDGALDAMNEAKRGFEIEDLKLRKAIILSKPKPYSASCNVRCGWTTGENLRIVCLGSTDSTR